MWTKEEHSKRSSCSSIRCAIMPSQRVSYWVTTCVSGSLVFCSILCCDKYHDQKHLKGGEDLFGLQFWVAVHPLLEKSGQELEAETLEPGCLWLILCLLFPYTAQGICQEKAGPQHAGSVNNRDSLFWTVPSQVTPVCVRLTVKTQTPCFIYK